MPFRDWLLRVVKMRRARRAAGVAAASLTTVATATGAQTPVSASAAPARPAGTTAKDTVHRYGEKFVLSPSDSIVVRADTVWYPRRSAPGVVNSAPLSGGSSATPAKTRDSSVAVPLPRSTGGGHQSHVSHSSHSSHRSMVGYRRGH